MSEMTGAAAGATSPCVGICRLSDDGFCVGCLRSVDEIAAWGRMDERTRRAIMAELERRRGAVEA
jgi:predicted Fe-S protein YdhL (DUF1289 family)